MRWSGAVLAAAVLSGCSGSEPAVTEAALDARLASVVTGGGDPRQAVPGAAVAVWRDGEIVWSAAAGAAVFADDGATPLRPLTPQSPVRAASISKLATALTALSLAEEGVLDMEADVTSLLGFELPVQSGGASVTLNRLLAHTSGICDPEVYWAPIGETLESLLTPEATCPYPPGEGWTYANINYGVAAQVMERATGESFDILARQHVLAPLGLDAGFNWATVSAAKRRSGATLYRRLDGVWTVQVDDAEALAGTSPTVLGAEDSTDWAARRADVGANGTLFSPQGGLRASVEDLAVLASALLPGRAGEALGAPVWTGDEGPGVRAYGPGPQILTPGQIGQRPDWRFVGHAGEAYGLYGGAWAIPAENATVAFFVTGVDPEGNLSRDPVSGFTRYEAALMAIALDALSLSTP